MHLVLDSNEYIIAFGASKENPFRTFLEYLLTHSSHNKIFICRSIINEVQRNLIAPRLKLFYDFIYSVCIVEEDYIVPFELGAAYESRGLKPGDAFIAAYTEHVKANLLVSENRHFLSRSSNLPFRVVTAVECLKRLKASH